MIPNDINLRLLLLLTLKVVIPSNIINVVANLLEENNKPLLYYIANDYR
jgi:hypothetical protein